jgi:Sulfatase-modifying factor enzyme 1
MPAINVSWVDAKQYVGWLSQLTGKEYRLLTEAEWEYAARAGANTRYSWGDDLGMGNANCDGCGSQWDLQQTAPVGSFKPNRLGLYDIHGNVWSGLRIAGRRTTTLRQLTDQRGSGAVTLASGSSAAAQTQCQCPVRHAWLPGSWNDNALISLFGPREPRTFAEIWNAARNNRPRV